MSTCDRSVKPLLTAELDELAGEADTELGRRIRDCPHWSAAARKILAANVVLNASLSERQALQSAALLARARSRDPAPGASRPGGWREGWLWLANRPAFGWVGAAIGLVAVATILLVFTLPQEQQPSPELAAEQAAGERTSQPLVVDAPGYDVAVIPTENPDVTIIWFAEERDDADVVEAIRDGPIAVGPANGL